MKRLFVNFFQHKDPVRFEEIKAAMLKNISQKHIDEIVVLAECDRPDWITDTPRVRWILLDLKTKFSFGRPNFELFFELANRSITSPYDISIISNSDIWLDETICLVDELDLEGTALAISRHEDLEVPRMAWHNSQDTWIFQGPIRPITSDFPMGLAACDWRLAWELVHSGYRLLNPCETVKCWHIHRSPVRLTVKNVVPGPHLGHIYPQRLDTCCIPKAKKRKSGIIGMSLFGNGYFYARGAVRNAQSIRYLYPDWQLRIYYDNAVSKDILKELADLKVDLVKKETSSGSSGMFWRFEVADDPGYEMWAIRDADSRLSYRERRAVDDWIESGKGFHIMIDHPGHTKKIMGGSFGGVRGIVPMKQLMSQWSQRTKYGDDESFLNQMVYPLIKDDVCIHHWDPTVKSPFPTKREGGRFVLEKINVDEFFDHDARHFLLDKDAERHGMYSPPPPGQSDDKERAALRSLDYSHEWVTAAHHIEELYEESKRYKNGTALELGSFKGHSTLALALAGLQVESWDYSSDYLKERSDLLDSYGLKVDWKIGAEEKSLEDQGTFDVIFQDARHGESVVPFLIELWNKKLNPGGLLIVHDVNEFKKYKLIEQIKPTSSMVTLDKRRREMGYFTKPL